MGNGCDAKVRSFAATGSGRRFVFDDTRKPEDKLCVDGVPVAVAPQFPLDVVVTEFAAAIELARKGSVAQAECEAGVQLSLAIARVLDEVALRCGKASG